LWKLQFQENSKYQSLVNVSHLSRACGHRFRVNFITSHPILPFLLTNSINELNEFKEQKDQRMSFTESGNKTGLLETFQKGMIIWGVEPVGPLCKSGGIYELARIDSSRLNAFENIAWFPCFLPSSTLGNSSSSPSTLFASTDSDRIMIYQAVFDARTLLHDIQNLESTPTPSTPNRLLKTQSNSSNITDIPFDSFNVVSIQSTARPGCIIELEQVSDSQGYWIKSDFFHVYQEGLIRNLKYNKEDQKLNNNNINSNHVFNETYFIVLLEKKKLSIQKKIIERVHMWKVNIKSSLFPDEKKNFNEQQTDNSKFEDNKAARTKNRLTITSSRVCSQDLSLPDGVHVICADTAAADLASSAMFSINRVPYLFSTACSDGIIRFWSCREKIQNNPFITGSEEQFEFYEWELNNSDNLSKSQIKIGHFPLDISCSYNSRFAVAYKKNDKKNTSPKNSDNDNTVIADYCVRIYECESTGGSEWKLEDCISLNNIVLPELDHDIDFDYINGNQKPIKPSRSIHSFKNIAFGNSVIPSSPSSSTNGNNSQNSAAVLATSPSMGGFLGTNFNFDSQNSAKKESHPEIPSNAAKISIKRQFSSSNSGNFNSFMKKSQSNLVDNKKIINLDWGSTENGSHVLTIGLGNQIFVYSCMTKEFSTSFATQSLNKKSTKNKNDCDDEDFSNCQEDSLLKWVQFRSFELDSADDLQALPSHVKWVREGLLIVGLDTEMHVYSQWSSLNDKQKLSHRYNHNRIHYHLNGEGVNIISNLAPQLVPKNHSVLDLNKLNRLAKESANSNKSKKISLTENNKDDYSYRKNSEFGGSFSLAPPTPKQRIFDENEMLEMIQDSGLFMQAKYNFFFQFFTK
jgi:hypothetical protein